MVDAVRTDGEGVSAPTRQAIDTHLLAECYEDLRRTARRLLRGDGGRSLIQPTELTHEAMIRLLQIDRMQFANRGHLLATGARMARRVLLDEVRRAGRLKRQAPAMMTLAPDMPVPVRLIDIDEAIEHLAAVSPEHAELVELRFTLGMTVDETADATGLSARTVKRRWAATRAWLLAWIEQHRDAP